MESLVTIAFFIGLAVLYIGTSSGIVWCAVRLFCGISLSLTKSLFLAFIIFLVILLIRIISDGIGMGLFALEVSTSLILMQNIISKVAVSFVVFPMIFGSIKDDVGKKAGYLKGLFCFLFYAFFMLIISFMFCFIFTAGAFTWIASEM